MLEVAVVIGLFSILLEIISRVDKDDFANSKTMSKFFKLLFIVTGIIAL